MRSREKLFVYANILCSAHITQNAYTKQNKMKRGKRNLFLVVCGLCRFYSIFTFSDFSVLYWGRFKIPIITSKSITVCYLNIGISFFFGGVFMNHLLFAFGILLFSFFMLFSLFFRTVRCSHIFICFFFFFHIDVSFSHSIFLFLVRSILANKRNRNISMWNVTTKKKETQRKRSETKKENII